MGAFSSSALLIPRATDPPCADNSSVPVRGVRAPRFSTRGATTLGSTMPSNNPRDVPSNNPRDVGPCQASDVGPCQARSSTMVATTIHACQTPRRQNETPTPTCQHERGVISAVNRNLLTSASPRGCASAHRSARRPCHAACRKGHAASGEVTRLPERDSSPGLLDQEVIDGLAGQFGDRLIELALPKLRVGSYFPDWLLEPRRRAEQAFVSVIADAYLVSVSTRGWRRLCSSWGSSG